jgi:hypothetical protein
MIDAEGHNARKQPERERSSQRDPSRLLTKNAKATSEDGKQRDDAVGQLAGALRAAKGAHRAYLKELHQGDVEPAEDWSTWYAEYLLGLR